MCGIGYLRLLKTVTLYPPVHSLGKLSLISIKYGANQTCPCVSSVGCDICVKSAEFLREEWGDDRADLRKTGEVIDLLESS